MPAPSLFLIFFVFTLKILLRKFSTIIFLSLKRSEKQKNVNFSYGGVSSDDLSNEGTCRAKIAKFKNARQRHKNENFEKNVTYIKERHELSMPAKNQGDWVRFGDRMAKNKNWPFLTTSHISIQKRFTFWDLDLEPTWVHWYFCMDIQDKGSF